MKKLLVNNFVELLIKAKNASFLSEFASETVKDLMSRKPEQLFLRLIGISMKGSFKIVTIAGIPVQIHWSFGLVVILVIYLGKAFQLDWVGTAMLGFLILALFLCVVLHEFGHALSAKYYGVRTRDITLSPIGGLARLDKLPDKPWQEFIIALAGPMVNAVIALFLGLGMYLFTAQGIQITSLDFISAVTQKGDFLPLLFWMNLMLVGFNMVPAFPMDGGRVFRSLLSMRLGRQKATLVAARLGQIIAVLFFITGLFYGYTLALIGVFVFFMAAQENRMVQFQYMLQTYRVSDVMRTEFTLLTPDTTIADVDQMMRQSLEKNFLILENGDDTKELKYLPQAQFYKALKLKQFTKEIKYLLQDIPTQLAPSDNLETVYGKMQKNKLYILPVFDDLAELVGVVDVSSLNHFLNRLKK